MQAIASPRSDYFETQVCYVEALGLFHTIDCHARPSAHDWVTVKRVDGPGIAIEPFRGQSFIGVVHTLNFYQLALSEQGIPRSLPAYPD
jgi:hypothetical protein